MKEKNYPRAVFYLLLFLSIIVGGVILKLTSQVIIPVAFSIMLSLAMMPPVRKLNQLHIPWIAAVLIIMAIVVVAVITFGSLLVSSLRTILTQYPRFEARLSAIYEVFAATFKLPFNGTLSLVDNLWNQLGVRTAARNLALTFSGYILSFSKTLILVLFLVLFLLSEMHVFREKIDAAFNGKIKGRVIHVFKNIILEVTRFISIKFIVSLLTGALITLGTFLIKLDFPVMWGFIAFVLNFIPIFGSAFSCGLTILFSIIQFYPSGNPIIFTAAVTLGVNLFVGNYLEPHIVGKNLGLSPFIVVVSLSLWGWMWGFSGMLLAVPVTVILKIICENISFLHPIAILLGDKLQETQKELSPVTDDDEDRKTGYPDSVE